MLHVMLHTPRSLVPALAAVQLPRYVTGVWMKLSMDIAEAQSRGTRGESYAWGNVADDYGPE